MTELICYILLFGLLCFFIGFCLGQFFANKIMLELLGDIQNSVEESVEESVEDDGVDWNVPVDKPEFAIDEFDLNPKEPNPPPSYYMKENSDKRKVK